MWSLIEKKNVLVQLAQLTKRCGDARGRFLETSLGHAGEEAYSIGLM